MFSRTASIVLIKTGVDGRNRNITLIIFHTRCYFQLKKKKGGGGMWKKKKKRDRQTDRQTDRARDRARQSSN